MTCGKVDDTAQVGVKCQGLLAGDSNSGAREGFEICDSIHSLLVSVGK